jgi:hypothetical protein
VGTVNQNTTGVSMANATQTENQCEDAATTTSPLTSCHTAAPNSPDADFTGPYSLTQNQYGPVGIVKFRRNHRGRRLNAHLKGLGASTQTGGNQGDTFTINQTSTQDNDQGSGGSTSNQQNFGQADCSTSGSCTATQTTTVNGSTTSDTQTGQDVNSSINCTGSDCTATAPPTPTITDHPTSPSDSSSASFSFTDTDQTVTFKCQIDNSGYTPCSSSWIYDNLADGSHTFYVKAKNGTGQLSDPATFAWTIAGGSASVDLVQQLNPASDPLGSCTDWYASGIAPAGGFDGTPGEVTDTADLSQYDGRSIQLRFSFSTGDNLYNAFEGWYIKNIQVTGTDPSNAPVTVFSDVVANGDPSFNASNDHGLTPGWHVTDRFGAPAWWYGNEADGTYQSLPSDGCTDSSANAGTITTSVFSLAANSQLSFDTLWQIEGVNSAHFDLMDVQVLPVTSGSPIP